MNPSKFRNLYSPICVFSRLYKLHLFTLKEATFFGRPSIFFTKIPKNHNLLVPYRAVAYSYYCGRDL